MGVLALKEQIILSALWMLGGSSIGPLIREKVIELSGKEIVYGTLYNFMEHLGRKGYVTTHKAAPTHEQGGKSKTVYTISKEGILALEETKKLHENIWKELPELRTGI